MLNKILIFLLFAVSAQAAVDIFLYPLIDVNDAKSFIEKPEKISGKFHQIKQLSSSGVSLKSSGIFAITDESIMWGNIEPTKDTLIINSKNVCTVVDGKMQTVDAGENNVDKDILHILKDFFSQDYSKIIEQFELYFIALDETSYIFGISSKGASGYIDRMVVYGGKNVERVVITEKNKDITRIFFSGVVESAEEVYCSE